MAKSTISKYRRQKKSGSTDLAFVELSGKRHYLGVYNSSDSKQTYYRLLAEWSANDQREPTAWKQITVAEVAAAFWIHAQAYYRRQDGTMTSEVDNYRQALRPLKQLYGGVLALDFGPKSLQAVRQNMIEAGWCRTNINKQVNRIKHIFKWATAQELIPPSVHQALACMPPLKRGRSRSKEPIPKRPVPKAHMATIEPFVSAQVWALVQLQLLTGARAGELVTLRPLDLVMGERVWTATLSEHKTAHHGHERVIYFGPQAQAMINKFLGNRPVDAYLFSPREAEIQRHKMATTHRRLNQPPNPKLTSRSIGAHYTTASYRRAIARACNAAGIPVWSPHQLRHTAATQLRKEFGLEAAQLMLGHARANVTQIYAEVNHDKAVQVAAKIG